MKPSEALVVLVTAGSEREAEALARSLVEEELVACVNLVPGIRSFYRWEGKVADDREVLLVAKTRRDRFADVVARVRALHSYDVPEVLALEVGDGSDAYLEWVDASVAKSG